MLPTRQTRVNSRPDPLPATPFSTLLRRPAFRWLAVSWLLVLAFVDTRLPHSNSRPTELDVDMDSSTDSIAQVFFDTGKGFNAVETTTAPVAGGKGTQTLVFPLPDEPVRAIRFDPLTVPGTVHLHGVAIRQPDSQQEARVIDLKGVTPLHEIASLTPQADGLEVVTTPGSGDSQLSFPVGGPIDIRLTWYEKAIHWIGVDVSTTLLALLAAGLVYWLGLRVIAGDQPWTAPVRWLDRRFAGWAAALSRPGVAELDRWVFWFYGACALVFGVLAAFGLHGSSLDEYSSTYRWSSVQTAPLLGQAREIRSDEWAVQTPAFLNQLFRRQAFEAQASTVGKQDAALLISLPSRDFTQLLRPQFWAFHFLPAPAAFAIYWQAKGFILLTGVFSLLLLLTRGHSGLSALGALWLFFSAHLQWAYSWASLLPEMLGFFGWTICLTICLCVGRNRYLLAAGAAACVVTALDFALCFYPPHQIPLVLFGAILVPVWLWTHRTLVFRRDMAPRRLLALAGCWGIVALLLVGFLLETRAGIATAANTVYPGRRVSAGGMVPLAQYVSHLLDFWKSDTHFPAALGNICEGTGFLWLLPLTLLPGWRRGAGRRVPEAMLAVCWVAAAILFAWTILPLPASAGHWLLLDHVAGTRCLPALGLINAAGVVVYLSRPRVLAPAASRTGILWVGAGAVAVLLGVAGLLFLASRAYPGFFTGSELTQAALYTTALAVCVLQRWRLPFTAALLLPLIFNNALINPVDRYLRVVTSSTLYKAVQRDPHLREGGWLVYSHDFTLTGFVVATGADVFNAFKVLPDLPAMAAFDPEHRSEHAYNQSGHMVVHPLPTGQPSRFENPDVGVLLWSVSPLDPALRRVGVRFLVFDEPPAPALVPGLRRVAPDVPAMWIYELP